MEEEEKIYLSYEMAGTYLLRKKYIRQTKLLKVFAYIGLAVLVVGLFLFLLVLSDPDEFLYYIPGIVVSSFGVGLTLGCYIPYLIIYVKQKDWIKKKAYKEGEREYGSVLKEFKGHKEYFSSKDNIFIFLIYLEEGRIVKEEHYQENVKDQDGTFNYEGIKYHLEFIFKDKSILRMSIDNRYEDDNKVISKLIDLPLKVNDSITTCPICGYHLDKLKKEDKVCLNCDYALPIYQEENP